MSTTAVTEVLNHQQIHDRIRRITWQIYENHADKDEVILAGIVERGYKLAQLLAKELRNISPLKVQLIPIRLSKKNPLNEEPDFETDQPLEGKSIVVVDDVLNTGRTLIYGVKYFLDYEVASIKTVVLVDRNHKSFPIKADFKGLSLSTNLKEHVKVQIHEEPYSVTVS